MNSIVEVFKDRSFLKKTLTIAIPVTLQNLLSNMLNLIDSLLIIRLGETAVTSVSCFSITVLRKEGYAEYQESAKNFNDGRGNRGHIIYAACII